MYTIYVYCTCILYTIDYICILYLYTVYYRLYMYIVQWHSADSAHETQMHTVTAAVDVVSCCAYDQLSAGQMYHESQTMQADHALIISMLLVQATVRPPVVRNFNYIVLPFTYIVGCFPWVVLALVGRYPCSQQAVLQDMCIFMSCRLTVAASHCVSPCTAVVSVAW